jgi:hypothetical protein
MDSSCLYGIEMCQAGRVTTTTSRHNRSTDCVEVRFAYINLCGLGIHSSNHAGYNTQIGFVLNQQQPIEIASTSKLMADDEQILTDSQSLMATLQTDFELDMEGLDMLFLAMPDAMPVPVVETMLIAKAPTATASSPSVRKMTYGVCKLFYAYNDAFPEKSSVSALNVDSFMINSLSPELQKKMSQRMSPEMGSDWVLEWLNSFKITVLRTPQHGKMVGKENNQYLPDKGYLGKDRIDLLVEAMDDLGRPTAVTFRFYINVLSEKERYKIADSKGAAFNRYIKKYCGTTRVIWRISESDTSEPLYALLTDAKDALTGFEDLPGASLAQTTSDKITLDTDAAGYGWFIDYTPYLNEEWLPTSNPYEWKAKLGSDAVAIHEAVWIATSLRASQ